MKSSLLLFAISIFLISCEKKPSFCPTSINLEATSLTPTVGDDVVLRVPEKGENDFYQWSGPGLMLTNQSNTLEIYDISPAESGMYYCNWSNSSCNTSLVDSVEIKVKLKQENPPCALTNNHLTSDGFPISTFTWVSRQYGGTWNTLEVSASGSYGTPEFTILFNSSLGNTEPLDGVYNTVGYIAGSWNQPNDISISARYASAFWHCQEGYKAYVSHINGKLSISFCDVKFSAPGMPVVTASGKITVL